MAKPGPKPTPTAILKLRGSWRGDRPNEMSVMAGIPDCPDWLGDIAKNKWYELVQQLSDSGVLAVIDRDVLARYCDTWERWRKIRDIIKHGEVVIKRDENGGIKDAYVAPHTRILTELAAQLTRLEGEFGLTPAARTRVQANESKQETDALSRFRRVGKQA